jgi:hypothetical protein
MQSVVNTLVKHITFTHEKVTNLNVGWSDDGWMWGRS